MITIVIDMSKAPKISDAELQVSRRPCGPKRQWARPNLPTKSARPTAGTLATVKTLLSRLLAKGAIKAEAEGRRFRYRPAVKREAVAGQAGKLVERLFGGAESRLLGRPARRAARHRSRGSRRA